MIASHNHRQPLNALCCKPTDSAHNLPGGLEGRPSSTGRTVPTQGTPPSTHTSVGDWPQSVISSTNRRHAQHRHHMCLLLPVETGPRHTNRKAQLRHHAIYPNRMHISCITRIVQQHHLRRTCPTAWRQVSPQTHQPSQQMMYIIADDVQPGPLTQLRALALDNMHNP